MHLFFGACFRRKCSADKGEYNVSLKQENRPAETFRTETDSIGSKQVPMDAYYGIQTARAYENFRIRFESMLASLFNESKTPVLYPRDADFGQHMLESAVISAAHRIYLNYCLDNYPVPTENPAGSPGQS
jgi:aspartate ammonia-lyase